MANVISQDVTCVSVFADGRIISASTDATLKLWDGNTGVCLQTIIGHKEVKYE